MGSRCLRRWINRPLRDHHILNNRYACVNTLLNGNVYKDVQNQLRQVGDIERISSRIALKSARPAIYWVLRNTLAVLPALQQTLATSDNLQLTQLSKQSAKQPEILKLLQHAIIDNPPCLFVTAVVIAPGYNQELDDLRNLSQNADQFLIDIETKEKRQPALPILRSITTRTWFIILRFPVYTLKKYRHITHVNRP